MNKSFSSQIICGFILLFSSTWVHATEWLVLEPTGTQLPFSGNENKYYFPIELKQPIDCKGVATTRFYLGLSVGTSGLRSTLSINQLISASNFALKIKVPLDKISWKMIDYYDTAYNACTADLLFIDVDYNSGSLTELNELPENTHVIQSMATEFTDRTGFYQIAYLEQPFMCDGVETNEVVFFPASYGSGYYDEGFKDNVGVWQNYTIPLIFNAAATKQLIRILPANARFRDDDPNQRNFCEVGNFTLVPYLYKPLLPTEQCDSDDDDSTAGNSDDDGSDGNSDGSTGGSDDSSGGNDDGSDGGDNGDSSDGDDNSGNGGDDNTDHDGPDYALLEYLLEPVAVETSDQYGHFFGEDAIESCFVNTSKWAAKGYGAWLTLDLGRLYQVTQLAVALDGPTNQTNDFVIEVSEDGVYWVEVLMVTQQVADNQHQYYRLAEAVSAQYIRYTHTGSSHKNEKVNLSNIKVYGR